VHATDIRFGLGAVKGVGDAALEAVTEARRGGPFGSLHDFCERVDLRRVNKPGDRGADQVRRLRQPGGEAGRGTMAALDEAVDAGQKLQRERELGQESLFGAEQIVTPRGGAAFTGEGEEWPENVLLANEKEALGFYITGHPLARHSAAIKRFATCDAAGLAERADKEEVSLCGIVAGIKELTTKKGDRMAFVTLEDLSGFIELVIFPEAYLAAAELLKSEEPLLVSRHRRCRRGGPGQAGGNGRGGATNRKLLVNEVLSLKDVQGAPDQARPHPAHHPRPGRGSCVRSGDRRTAPRRLRGVIHLVIPNRSETVVRLPDSLRVQACDELMDDVRKTRCSAIMS
jgi:DNA polymerase III subunit alpha